MFLTDCSHGKAQCGPLPQPFANASGILFWLSNGVLQKERAREIFKEMDHFFFHRKRMFILYQSTDFERYNIHPSSLPTAKQSSSGGKLHNEIHNKTCLHMQRTLQTPVCLFPDTSAREGMLSHS